MEDRIQINGEWYVREGSDSNRKCEALEGFFDVNGSAITVYINDDDVFEYEGLHYEAGRYAFSAERFPPELNHINHASVHITFTDKRDYPHVEELWDNDKWFKEILENKPEAIVLLRESVCQKGAAEFKAFLKYLKAKEWI